MHLLFVLHAHDDHFPLSSFSGKMRVTPTKVLNFFTAAVLLVLLWTVFRQSNGGIFSDYNGACDLPAEFREDLHRLVSAAHNALDQLDLTHFLCYGSLFGQVRRSATLPWERDAELCVLNEEVARYDELYIKNAFKRRGMHIYYDSAEGRYVVSETDLFAAHNVCILNMYSPLPQIRLPSRKKKPSSASPPVAAASPDAAPPSSTLVDPEISAMDPSFRGYAELVVFARDKGVVVDGQEMYHRVGWKRRLLPADCEFSPELECFPARLATAPLPLR